MDHLEESNGSVGPSKVVTIPSTTKSAQAKRVNDEVIATEPSDTWLDRGSSCAIGAEDIDVLKKPTPNTDYTDPSGADDTDATLLINSFRFIREIRRIRVVRVVF